MAIRITVTPFGAGTLVKIDGTIDAGDVSEIDAVCAPVDEPVVLDLSDLKTIDEASEACLHRLIDEGAIVRAAAPYIRMRLGLSTR